MQHRDALGEREGDVHVVLDQQHRDVGREAFDHGDHRRRLGGREPGGRFVEQQGARPACQREEQLDLSLLAVGQLARRHVTPIREVPLRQHGLRAFAEPTDRGERPEQRAARAVRALDGEAHALEDGESRKERGDLKRAAEPEPRALVRRQRRDVVAEEPDGAGHRRKEAGESVEERGLAGPVRAEDHAAFPHADRERDVVQRTEPAEIVRQARNGKRVHGALTTRRRRHRSPSSPAGAKSVTAM